MAALLFDLDGTLVDTRLARALTRLLRILAVGSSVVAAAACSRPRAPEPPAVTATAVWKPVSFSVLEDYDKGEDLADVERDFVLFERLGVHEWRGSFGWDDYEPERGRLDLAWLRAFVSLADRHGLRLHPYLGYTPEWAAAGGSDHEAWNDPPRSPDDWARFAGGVARALRRHRNLASLEIYNEEDARLWWDGTPQAYRDVLRRGAQAIRAARPGLPVLIGGLVFPDAGWLEAVCSDAEAARSFDVLAFHAYPETWTPEGVTVESYLDGLAGFLAAADARCGRKPVWINEAGFATTPGRSERDQAAWWVRALASFLHEPRVEHVGLYEIKDARPDRPVIGEAPNYHLGLLHSDRAPKLAFATVARLVELLGVGRIADVDAGLLAAVQPPGAAVHAHAFLRPDGEQVLFAWTRAPGVSVDLAPPRGGTSATEYGIDGAPAPAVALAGRELRALRLEPGVPRVFLVSP